MKLSAPFVSALQKQRGVVEDHRETGGFHQYATPLQQEMDTADSHIDRMLISSERFTVVHGEGLQRLIDVFCNMQVLPIIYLRRQDLLAESLQAQAYRVRLLTFQPEKLLTQIKRTFCFWDLITTWRNAFGEQNLIVRKFQKRSVTFDFLKAIGIPDTSELPEEFRLNAGLSRDAMEYIRHHTNLVYGSPEYMHVERRLVEFSRNNPTPVQHKYFFSPQQRTQLLELYTAQNQRVAQEIFGEADLFSDSFPTTNEPWEKYPGLSPNAKRQIEDFIQTANAA